MKTVKDFVCGNCGSQVYRMPIPKGETPRNSCPECNWSRHVGLGGALDKAWPPCGGMMKPHVHEDGQVTWRCRGCNFMITAPSEKNMELLVTSPFVRELGMVIHNDTNADLNGVRGFPDGLLSLNILNRLRRARGKSGV